MKRSGCVALTACRLDFKHVRQCSLCRDVFMKLCIFYKDDWLIDWLNDWLIDWRRHTWAEWSSPGLPLAHCRRTAAPFPVQAGVHTPWGGRLDHVRLRVGDTRAAHGASPRSSIITPLPSLTNQRCRGIGHSTRLFTPQVSMAHCLHCNTQNNLYLISF